MQLSKNSLPIQNNIEFEINLIKEEVIKNKKIFIPIIIDKEIRYDNENIPEWFKEYNLRYISKPTKAIAIITSILNEKLAESKNLITAEQRQAIFVGRNTYIEQFEQIYYSDEISVYFISGFEGIGRKSFISHCLSKVRKIKNKSNLYKISLSQYQGIEDFIAKINDLGVSHEVNIKSLLDTTVDEKIEICVEQISNFQNPDDIVIITDQKSIVYDNGLIADWFHKFLTKITDRFIGLRLIICTKMKLNKVFLNSRHISIPELNPNEIHRLLIEYLNLFELKLTQDEIDSCKKWLHGFPSQVYYLVNYIKEHTYRKTYENSNEIVLFNNNKAESILQPYLEDEQKMAFIATLAESQLINVNTFLSSFPTEKDNENFYTDLLEKLILNNLCVYEGVSGEFVRLSEVISNYVIRKRFKSNLGAINNLRTIIQDDKKKYPTEFEDISHFYISMEDKIKNKELTDSLIFPSHIARIMQNIYNQRNDDTEVIRLAEFLISKAGTITKEILRVARYFLCLALARTLNQRVQQEVSFLEDFSKYFILGFYYRKSKNYKQAIEYLQKALSIRPTNSRAKGELVRSYIAIKDMGAAFKLAKENYSFDSSNIYFAQSYFECLLDNYLRNIDTGSECLQEIDKILKIKISQENKKDFSMLAVMRSKYFLHLKKNIVDAFGSLSEYKQKFSNYKDIHILNAEFAIYRQKNDLENMKRINNEINDNINPNIDFTAKLNNIYILQAEKDNNHAIQEIKNLPSNIFSDEYKQRMIEELPYGI